MENDSVTPADQPVSAGDEGERAPVSTGGEWRQRAAFFLFVEASPPALAEVRQTRIYHEESGEEVTLAGFDQAAVIGWIAGRLRTESGHSTADADELPGATGPEPATPASFRSHLVRLDLVSVGPAARSPAAHGDEQEIRVEAVMRAFGLGRLATSLGELVVGEVFSGETDSSGDD
ncbi:MAG: hypothetical protein QNM02_01110 [Acidimicrobiia bacterium]|nr:hypothetical protein [Acidimicrobiia bacterium]